jgi:hypothetical protein
MDQYEEVTVVGGNTKDAAFTGGIKSSVWLGIIA